jgi:hypothetical protein
MREFAGYEVLLVVSFVALFVLGFFYHGSLAAHRSSFAVDEVTPVAAFETLEVLRLRDAELGLLVGIYIPTNETGLRVALAPGEARRLAGLLEAAAAEIPDARSAPFPHG